MFSPQDKEILSIFKEFAGTDNIYTINNAKLFGYFYSGTSFILSRRVLTEMEIKILEKGLDCAPMQKKRNKPEIKQDLKNFFRKMRLK